MKGRWLKFCKCVVISKNYKFLRFEGNNNNKVQLANKNYNEFR